MALCLCGCKQEITMKPYHKRYGVPKYISGHNSKGETNPLYGKHHSKETKRKISISEMGKYIPEEVRKKMSESHKGKIQREETKQKRSGKNNHRYGKHWDEETKKRISESEKGKVITEETRRKMGISKKGKKNNRYGKPPAHGKRIYHESQFQGIVCFRSSWEFAYAKYLDSIKEPWFYEFETFELLGENTYTPDFFLPRQEKFIEIKGRIWTKEGSKCQRFQEEYPFDLEVLYGKDLKEMGLEVCC